MFIDKGDASAASSHTLQTADATLDILTELIESLLERLRAEQDGVELPERSPEAEQTLDEMVAEAAINAMAQNGSEFHQTESGEWFNICYTEGGFTIRANLEDPTEMPVYTVSTLEQGDVLSFHKSPSGEGYTFIETEGALDDGQKLKSLESLKAQLDAEKMQHPPPTQISAVDRVKARVKLLGDLAPAGSRAVLVAHEFLEQSGGKPIFGNIYVFSRDVDGSISVGMKQEPDQPIFKMNPNGRMEGTADPNVLSNFKQMYQKLTSVTPAQQPTATAAKSTQSIDKGER
jgi:hypothetical protein